MNKLYAFESEDYLSKLIDPEKIRKEQRECRECGLQAVPMIEVYVTKRRYIPVGPYTYCTECASGLGLWPRDEVDMEIFHRLDKVALGLLETIESGEAFRDYRRSSCSATCYCAPFEEKDGFI